MRQVDRWIEVGSLKSTALGYLMTVLFLDFCLLLDLRMIEKTDGYAIVRDCNGQDNNNIIVKWNLWSKTRSVIDITCTVVENSGFS